MASVGVSCRPPTLSPCRWSGTLPHPTRSALQKLISKRKLQDSSLELFLLHEAALGNASHWAPYINLLPTRVPLSSQFTDAELSALQDETVSRTARENRRVIQTQYERLKGDIRTLLSKGLGLPPDSVTQWASLDAYSWACSIVASRALSLKGELYLVPYADMIGYSPSKVPPPPLSVPVCRHNRASNDFLLGRRRTARRRAAATTCGTTR